jgi:hypothetical protein
MSQTSVAEQAVGFPGQFADAGFGDVISRVAEVAVPFGKFVVQGTDKDNQANLPGAATDITNTLLRLGIAMKTHGIESDPNVALPTYPIKSVMSVMKKGRAWVVVEESVSPSDPVYVRYAAGGSGKGSFGKTAGSTERALLANARYLTTASADGLAMVEVDC